jgi:peptidoglycan hydrolase CwlO-like protein
MKKIIDLKVKKYFLTIIFLFSIILNIMTFMIDSTALEQEINIEQQQQKLNEIEQRKREIQKEMERLKQEEVDYQKSLTK